MFPLELWSGRFSSDYILRGEEMDKQRVKGAIDQTVGSAKRHVGGWTGNINTQVEGAAQQIKGKAETAVGKLKDTVRAASADATAQQQASLETERERREVTVTEKHNLL
jgi:uncharacterized protein YjbJ (UPF0337 family)